MFNSKSHQGFFLKKIIRKVKFLVMIHCMVLLFMWCHSTRSSFVGFKTNLLTILWCMKHHNIGHVSTDKAMVPTNVKRHELRTSDIGWRGTNMKYTPHLR